MRLPNGSKVRTRQTSKVNHDKVFRVDIEHEVYSGDPFTKGLGVEINGKICKDEHTG